MAVTQSAKIMVSCGHKGELNVGDIYDLSDALRQAGIGREIPLKFTSPRAIGVEIESPARGKL
jgi:hypothetical protein